MGLRNILLMRFLPERPQIGLSLLRVWTGLTLFLRHGWEKQPAHWMQFMEHFPNPIGIGAHASFFIAFLSDFVCGILLIIGLGPDGPRSIASLTFSSPGHSFTILPSSAKVLEVIMGK